MFLDDEFDTSVLEDEVAKAAGEEGTHSESTTEETSTEETSSGEKGDESTDEKKPSGEGTHEDTTSLKSEEKPPEEEEDGKEEESEKEDEKTGEEEGEDTRFDKHPRFQRLRQERDDALERARIADELEEAIGGLPADQIKKLRNVGELLNKHPDLAKKLQKTIDEHPYDREQLNTRLEEIVDRQQKLEDDIALRQYDAEVDRLITQNKVAKNAEPLVKELLEIRCSRERISNLSGVSRVFDKVLKDVDRIQRKAVASHIVDKGKEKKVPASTTKKGKVIAQKNESGDIHTVVEEITEGMKALAGDKEP